MVQPIRPAPGEVEMALAPAVAALACESSEASLMMSWSVKPLRWGLSGAANFVEAWKLESCFIRVGTGHRPSRWPRKTCIELLENV